MDDAELRERQDPDNWDFDRAGERAPVQRPRAVVSVAFQRADYERVAETARRFNMRTSEYIREAALGRVRPRPVVSGVISAGGGVVHRDFTGAANVSVTLDQQPGATLVET